MALTVPLDHTAAFEEEVAARFWQGRCAVAIRASGFFGAGSGPAVPCTRLAGSLPCR